MSIKTIRDHFHLPGEQRTEASPATPDTDAGTAPRLTMRSAVRHIAAPLARLSERKLAIGPGFYALGSSGASDSIRPDVRGKVKAGASTMDAARLTARLSAGRTATITAATRSNVDALVSGEASVRARLFAKIAKTPVADPGVRLADVRHDALCFQTLVTELFGAAAAPLAQRLAAHAGPAGADSHLPPTLLAGALMEVTGGHAGVATQVLDDLARPAATPAPNADIAVLANRLRRTLALTNSGMAALLAAEHPAGPPPADPAAHQQALQLCHLLAQAGHAPSAAGSTGTVAEFLAQRPADVDLSRALDDKGDHPLLLAYQALNHAQQLSTGTPGPAADQHHRYAYLASRDGHHGSGAGTDFHAMNARMAKFGTYVARGTIDERSFANIRRHVGSLFKRMVNQGKSPMEHLRHGAMGADRGTLTKEQRQFADDLRTATTTLGTQLRSEAEAVARRLNQRADAGDQRQLARTLGRLATLEWWADQGRKDIRPDPAAIVQRAQQLATELPDGLNVHSISPVGEQAISNDIGGHFHAGRQLNIKLLERWTGESGTAQPADLQALTDLRATARGHKPAYAMLTLGDLRNSLRGRAPREGFGPDRMRQTVLDVTRGESVASLSLRDGGVNGFNTGGINVNGGPLPLAVVPLLRGENGYSARIEMGHDGPRFVFSIAHVHNSAAGAGVGVGLDPANPVPALAVGVGAALDFTHTHAHSRGGSIIVRKDIPGTDVQAVCERVVNFMFDQAAMHPPPDGAQWWRNFSDAFADEPAVSLSYVDNAAHKNKLALRASAALKLKEPKDLLTGEDPGRSLGLGLSLQLSQEWESSTQHVDNGRMQVSMEVRTRKSQLTGNANLVGSAGKVMIPPAEDPGQTLIGVNAVPVVGVGFQFDLSAQKVITQVSRQDGETVVRQTKRDFQFSSPDALVRFINTHGARYEAAASTTNDAGQRVGGAAALEAYKQRLIAGRSPGETIYGVEQSMTPDAAAEHGRLADLAATFSPLAGTSPAMKAKLDHLERQMKDLMNDENSWDLKALYQIGLNGRSETRGIDFLLKMQHVGGANAARLQDVLVF